jgi:hypothetical protein
MVVIFPSMKKKDEPPEWVKVKMTAGSQQGLICNLTKWKDASVTHWGKMEGPTDLGAVESAFEGDRVDGLQQPMEQRKSRWTGIR